MFHHDTEVPGDDDIPYRERKKEKEARVRREVEKRRGEGGEDLDADITQSEGLDDTASLGAGKRKRGDDPSGEESENGYYELVKRVKKDQKEKSKRAYEEERLKDRFDINVFSNEVILMFQKGWILWKTMLVVLDR